MRENGSSVHEEWFKYVLALLYWLQNGAGGDQLDLIKCTYLLCSGYYSRFSRSPGRKTFKDSLTRDKHWRIITNDSLFLQHAQVRMLEIQVIAGDL